MYKISVPATTANIGPGFDSFGLALKMYNHFTIDSCEKLVLENCEINNRTDNLVYTSAMKIFENYYGTQSYPKGIYIKFDTNIPLSRGLGSSATCITAGVIGANLLLGQPYSTDELFEIAVSIEGHPDNVAPAFYGGLNISTKQEDKVIHKKVIVSPKYHFFVLIPDFNLSTSKSRFVLPTKVNFKDAVANIANAALMVLSLIDGDVELLKSVSDDKLHEPYRKSLIPGFDDIKEYALTHGGIACFLSGAGPSLLCIVEDLQKFGIEMTNFFRSGPHNWVLKQVDVDNDGVTWTEI